MDPFLSELLKQGVLGLVIAGLVYAIKLLRLEHSEREKLWKGIFDQQNAENNTLQQENVTALKEGIRASLELAAQLQSLKAEIQNLKAGAAKGGA